MVLRVFKKKIYIWCKKQDSCLSHVVVMCDFMPLLGFLIYYNSADAAMTTIEILIKGKSLNFVELYILSLWPQLTFLKSPWSVSSFRADAVDALKSGSAWRKALSTAQFYLSPLSIVC